MTLIDSREVGKVEHSVAPTSKKKVRKANPLKEVLAGKKCKKAEYIIEKAQNGTYGISISCNKKVVHVDKGLSKAQVNAKVKHHKETGEFLPSSWTKKQEKAEETCEESRLSSSSCGSCSGCSCGS